VHYNRKCDLDNAAGKAVLDLLTAHGVIMDDSLVTSITSRWDATVPPGRAIIIKSAMAASAPVFGAIWQGWQHTRGGSAGQRAHPALTSS
jgi:hypothetical protein